MIDFATAQTRLGVKPDNNFGPVSYQALLERVAGRPLSNGRELAMALTANAYAFGVDANPYRLAGFVGQTAHETQGYRYLREVWGPTDAQRRYEGRIDLGNTVQGDGKLYLGRGLIQITGRANYRTIGREIGIDLEAQPYLAEQPSTAVLTALAFWRDKNLNVFCDLGDWKSLTTRINGGAVGLADRINLIVKALEVLK